MYENQRIAYLDLQVAIINFTYKYWEGNSQQPSIGVVSDLQREILKLISDKLDTDNKIVTIGTKTT